MVRVPWAALNSWMDNDNRLVTTPELEVHNLLYQSSSPFLLLIQTSEMRYLPFFCHKINIPGLSSTPMKAGNQNSQAVYPAHGVEKEDFKIECWTDTELRSWLAMYAWVMRSTRGSSHDDTNEQLATAEDPPSYSDATMAEASNLDEYYDSTTVHGASRAVVLVLNNKKIPTLKITMDMLFPHSVGGFDLITTANSSDPLLFTTSFSYNLIKFERMKLKHDPIMQDEHVVRWLEGQRRTKSDQPQA